MPRKRKQENKSLPERWVLNHGAYYYIVPSNQLHLWNNKKWFRLGKTLAEAHKVFSENLYEHGASATKLSELFDAFEYQYLPTKSHATQKYYLNALPVLRKVFLTNSDPAIKSIEPYHAYQMMTHVEKVYSKKKAAQSFECLSSAFTYSVKLGFINRNPFIGQVKKPSSPKMKRQVTNDELIAFASTLPRKWQLYISLKLLCKGRRKAELLRLKKSHLTDEGILFTNNKRSDDVFIVSWTPDLQSVVNEIIAIHPHTDHDSYLFFGRGFKPYIKENGETSGFDSIWKRYMKKAVDNRLCDHFTEHNLRSKAVENYDLDTASHLLRHTTTAVTSKHYRPKIEKL